MKELWTAIGISISIVLLMGTLVSIGISIYNSGKNAPTISYWKNMPGGKYTFKADYDNDRIVYTDVYGKEALVFRRVANELVFKRVEKEKTNERT